MSEDRPVFEGKAHALNSVMHLGCVGCMAGADDVQSRPTIAMATLLCAMVNGLDGVRSTLCFHHAEWLSKALETLPSPVNPRS